MTGLKVVTVMVLVMMATAEEPLGEGSPILSLSFSRVSSVRMPKLGSSRNPVASPSSSFSELVAAHSEPVPSFSRLSPISSKSIFSSSSEEPAASFSASKRNPSSHEPLATTADPEEPIVNSRKPLTPSSIVRKQFAAPTSNEPATHDDDVDDEPVSIESSSSSTNSDSNTAARKVPVRTLVRVSKVPMADERPKFFRPAPRPKILIPARRSKTLMPAPRSGIPRTATFIPRNRFPDIKKHRPSPEENVIVGKSPCPRGTRGSTCRRQLALDALTCTSGSCHQCRKDCSNLSPSMWPTCCRDHFLCCRHLASACQKCDTPQLVPFCGAAFKKCY